MDASSCKTISALLERMVATDTDYRFMAMNDLINELQSDTLRLDYQSEKKVVHLILRLLRDPSGEVQSLAVKSLGPLTTKVKNQQIKVIVKDLVETMDTGGEGQLQSICSIGLKTVMNALPSVSDFTVVQAALQEALEPLIVMVSMHTDDNVRVEACEVLAEMINSFGARLKAHHSNLLDCMLTCLGYPQTAVRKRAIQALGALSWAAPQTYFASLVGFLLFRLQTNSVLPVQPIQPIPEQLQALISGYPNFQNPPLLNQLKESANADIVKTLLQCLNVVSRQLQRVPQYFQSTLHLLTSLLNTSDPNNTEQDDIHELVIQVLETMIRRCPRAIVASIPEIIKLLCEHLEYDPNYDYGTDDGADTMAVDNGDTDFEDDEDEEYSDDEDMSWKVRRASSRALEAIVLVYPEMTADFYLNIAPLLIKRFNEREESVRLAIYSCLSSLLRATRLTTIGTCSMVSNMHLGYQPVNRTGDTTNTFMPDSVMEEFKIQLQDPNSAQSRLLALLPILCKAIQKQISQPSNKGSKISSSRTSPTNRHAAFMLIHDLGLALPGQLGPYLDDIFSVIDSTLGDSMTTNTSKMEMINVLVLLLSSHSTNHFSAKSDLLVQLTINAVNDPFYRVSSEGLDLLQILCAQLRPLGAEKYAMILFEPLFTQLQATDRDMELKEKAIAAAGVFIAQVGDLIPATNLDACLDVIYRRLKNELTRLAAVRAIQIIAASQLHLNLSKFLPPTTDELATLLSKNDRSLRMATLRCLYTIWFKHRNSIGLSCLTTVLNQMPKTLISENDLQTSQLAIYLISFLLECGGTVGNQVLEVLTKDAFVEPLIKLSYSPLLRGQALGAMLRLMRAIGHIHEDNQNVSVTFFLSRLLGPIEGNALLKPGSPISPGSVTLHRDALPSLAHCIAELLGELPMNSSVQDGSSPNLDSVHTAVDRLLILVKDPKATPTQVYLNLLILGELSRKIDLSSRTDLRDLLINCLSTLPIQPISAQSPAYQPLAYSEEVKPAAALSLGRLVVGNPQIMLPPLIERISEAVTVHTTCSASPSFEQAPGSESDIAQHMLYYLIQALKEVLVNLAGLDPTNSLKMHLDSMWSLLLACASLPKEGTRNLVAECLGRLTLVSPHQLIDRMREQLNSPEAAASVLMRCTLVTAVKFILIVTDLDAATQTRFFNQTRGQESNDWPILVPFQHTTNPDNTITLANKNLLAEVESVLRSGNPPALVDFLSRLADPELSVRRAALVSLNTVTHHRPGCVRPLLNQPINGLSTLSKPTLLDLLYAETAIRKELIHEVEMGPFKHHEDDGLDLRKCAFECMSTLLETCLDKLVIAQFLEPLIDGLKDHTDIKLLSYQMIQRITLIRPLEIAAKMEAIAAPLKAVLLSKPKAECVKQEIEKMQELNRSAIGVIINFRLIDDIDKNRYYADLLRTIESDPNLKATYMQMLSNESNSPNSPSKSATYSFDHS